MKALTVTLDDETVGAVERLAAKIGRSREWVISEAVQDYLAMQAWQLEKIAAGIEAADRGDFVTQAEIDRIARKYDPDA